MKTHITSPVKRLVATATGRPVENPLRITGVMMQYYHVCKRELWFEAHDIEIDRENAGIVRGTAVDERSYADRGEQNLRFGMISLDLLEDGRPVEIKPSSAMTEPAEMQLSYYLWYLDRVADVQRDGVLAHPRERRRETVTLTAERTASVEAAIRGITEIIEQETPPPAEEKPFCDSCAYYDFCWC